ncbi:MAG: hypothetical protein K2H76_01080, partial [Muribaculaceae bacterium]|nr:hypothetical protein [Muribaculaceae bacterium]
MMALLVYYQAECSIALKNDNHKEALSWFKKILATEGIDNLPFVKFDVYNNMHLSYAALGDYSNAYNTVLESNALRDSIWEKEKEESLRDLTVKYETKETQLALAQSEAKRARTLVWLFAALGLLLVGVIIFVIYASRQRRRRMQKEIEFANLRAEIGEQMTQQYIEGLETERNRMARELHDGVCNDLLAIQMNIKNGQPIESTERLIASCRESVRRISHELMPPEFSYATLDEVIRYFVSKQAEAHAGKVDIRYVSSREKGDWTEVPDAAALEVYRIAQETVGNALKHSGADEILVELNLTGEEIELKIRDNGGYTPSLEKGIGLESIKKRANSIRGTISIHGSEKEGTEIVFRGRI